MVAAVQRRLQEEASLTRLWRVSGAFMHAAPLDVSGLMLDSFLANEPLPHPWYLMAIGQSYQTYAPGAFPDVEPNLLPAFLDVYRHRMNGSASIAELDALWLDRNTSRPLDALTAGYRARLQAECRVQSAACRVQSRVQSAECTWAVGYAHRTAPPPHRCLCCPQDRSSSEHLQLVAAFEAHGDLHAGWQQQAVLAQHLCTGSDDLEVDPLISSQVAPQLSTTALHGRCLALR